MAQLHQQRPAVAFDKHDIDAQLGELRDVQGGLEGELESLPAQLLGFHDEAAPGHVLLPVRGQDHGPMLQDLPGRERGGYRQQFRFVHARHRDQLGAPQKQRQAAGEALGFGGRVWIDQRGLGVDEGDDHGPILGALSLPTGLLVT